MRHSSSRESQSTSRRRSSATTTTSQSTRRSSSVTTTTQEANNARTQFSAAGSSKSNSSNNSSNRNSNSNTIALFGAGSPTAAHFLRLALDAGYRVRALLVQSDHALASRSTYPGRASRLAKSLKEEFADCCSSHPHPQQPQQLEWVRAGSVYDAAAVAAVLQGATYVVCMMNHDAPLVCEGEREARRPVKYNAQKKKREETPLAPDQPLTSFLQTLYPLMRREESIRVFLYQATSLASDVKGNTPVFSKVLKTAAVVGGAAANALPFVPASGERSLALQDQDAAVQEIARQHRRRRGRQRGNKENGISSSSSGGGKTNNTKNDSNPQQQPQPPLERPHFAYILTRPTTLLKEGPSTRTVAASRSQPGPFPIAHVDLAEFSLNALLTNKLYNSCPYVV